MIFPKINWPKASLDCGETTLGGGTSVSGGGTPDIGCGTPVPAEFNHWLPQCTGTTPSVSEPLYRVWVVRWGGRRPWGPEGVRHGEGMYHFLSVKFTTGSLVVFCIDVISLRSITAWHGSLPALFQPQGRSDTVLAASPWQDRAPGTLFQHHYPAAILYPLSVVIWKLNCLSERITSTLVTVSSCKSGRT